MSRFSCPAHFSQLHRLFLVLSCGRLPRPHQKVITCPSFRYNRAYSRFTSYERRKVAMKKMCRFTVVALWLVAAIVSGSMATPSEAQNAAQPAPDHPAVSVHGRTYTPRSILERNMGTSEDQTAQFAPHKIIDNLYYV